MRDKKERISILILFIAAVIWGGGFVAGKLALDSLRPFSVLSYRFLLSSCLTFVVFLRRILGSRSLSIKAGIAIGLTQFLAISSQLTGLQYTSSAKQSFLCTAYVVIVPFIAFLTGSEKLTLKAVLAGLLSLSGIGLISLNTSSFSIAPGDWLSLGFALVFAIQIVLVRWFVTLGADPVALTFFQQLTAGSLALIMATITGCSLTTISTTTFLGLFYLVVLNTFVAFLLQNVAQKNIAGTTAALIISLQSVFGFLSSVVVFHEHLTVRFAIGGLLCFLAIVMDSVGTEKQKSTPEA